MRKISLAIYPVGYIIEPKIIDRSDCMEEKKTCPCCEERHKERSDKEYKDLIHRLNRMEGQIPRGLKEWLSAVFTVRTF